MNTDTPTSREHAESDAIFLSIGEGALVTDEKGNISRINDAALNILGYKLEDLLGKWYPETLVAEEEDGRVIPHLERPVTEVFLSGRPVFRRIYYRRKDNTRVPVALTVSPVISEGQPIGAVQVFRDVTEEVKLENAKDEFISIASHQLRTPATVVKQHIGMILEGYLGEVTDTQKTMLRTAYEHNDYQLTIINDLLKVAQLDANKIKVTRKVIDINELLLEITETQKPEYAASEIKLIFSHPATPISCSVDPLHLRMVFDNLIDNARKYSKPGGSVTVALSSTPNRVKVAVKDTGIGIDEKDVSKLFQKFSRIPNASAASGNGLGLYWASKLIHLHNGQIDVASKLDIGTTFTVKIPRGNV